MNENRGKIEISTVLFDIDGTLINTVPLIMASHRHTFNKILGWIPSDEEILSTVGEPLVATFGRYGDQGETLMAEYIRWSVPRTASHSTLFEGIVPMLESLRSRGFLTGIVTARRCEGMAICLDAFDLSALFDVRVCAEDTARHKPDPEPILFAMEKLGISRTDQVLYVGDTVRDLESARRAGCHFAAVGWTSMDREEIDRLGPAFWLERAEDLPAKLRLVKPA
ncbi:MAG TPA: HAD-IA family hydrolase [Bacillota bacterium]|jgi:pyrophosphatase PpaX|nr:HAD-IA family hydrolase [Bacillota bacterium]HQB81561.1 HAD-IA family hydrolase [Bacillota bacterium]